MLKHYILIILLVLTAGCSQKSSVKKETFDPSYQKYSNVLKTYVKSEQVDYLQLKKNRADLDHFINQLAGINNKQLQSMTKNEQLAFWINAYNGITLRSIIDNYPVGSIQDIEGVWKETKWYVAEQIEEENLFGTILDKLNLLGGDKAKMYMFDNEMEKLTTVQTPDTSL